MKNLIGRYYYYPSSMETESAITEAVKKYIEKTHSIPQFVYVHPKNFTVDLVTVDGHHVQVIESKKMQPNVYWVCEEIR